MEINLTDTQWIMIVVGVIGVTYYFSRCGTQHEIKFRIRWWLRDLDRWLVHRIESIEKWNDGMTKKKWYMFGVIIVSLVFVPVIVMNVFTFDVNNLYSSIAFYVVVFEYVLLMVVLTRIYLKQREVKLNES